jgi:hypothetical protein
MGILSIGAMRPVHILETCHTMVRGANTTFFFWLISETTILLESLQQEKVLTTLAVLFT